MTLGDLGVSARDEAVYRLVLELGGCAVIDVAPALRMDETEAGRAVERLIELGLLEAAGAGRITAGNPHTALDRLAERRIAESLTHIHRMAALRSAWPQLLDGLAGPAPMVERIVTADDVTERMVAEANARPPAEIRSVKSGKTVRRIGDAGYTATVDLIARGVRYRTLVGRSQLDSPVMAAYYRNLHQLGDRVRISDEPFQVMTLFDNDRAFVPMEPGAPHLGALFIRNPGIVTTLGDLFDLAWDTATDIDLVTGEPVSATELRVLRALATAAKDEVAAKQLNISVRTFRRHVSELMDRVRADNRFRLAIIAKERGWI
ncbi:MAG: response regulator transcription factor [Hamadaea sp.]|nr:response regulator transcription factor [Hamadaea sp.]